MAVCKEAKDVRVPRGILYLNQSESMDSGVTEVCAGYTAAHPLSDPKVSILKKMLPSSTDSRVYFPYFGKLQK